MSAAGQTAEELCDAQHKIAELKDLMHKLAGVLWRLEKNGYIRDIEYGDEETAGELAHLMSVGMKAVDDARAELGQPKIEVPNVLS